MLRAGRGDRLGNLDARPIRRGRLGHPTEFGYKAQVVDNDDGIVLDHTVQIGNPADAPQLAPAIARITDRVGRPARAVTADRGYGQASVEAALHPPSACTPWSSPRKGQPGPTRRAVGHRPGFRNLVKWRTGCEGRISHLRTSIRMGPLHARWHPRRPHLVRTDILAHNLTKISTLAG